MKNEAKSHISMYLYVIHINESKFNFGWVQANDGLSWHVSGNANTEKTTIC